MMKNAIKMLVVLVGFVAPLTQVQAAAEYTYRIMWTNGNREPKVIRHNKDGKEIVTTNDFKTYIDALVERSKQGGVPTLEGVYQLDVVVAKDSAEADVNALATEIGDALDSFPNLQQVSLTNVTANALANSAFFSNLAKQNKIAVLGFKGAGFNAQNFPNLTGLNSLKVVVINDNPLLAGQDLSAKLPAGATLVGQDSLPALPPRP